MKKEVMLHRFVRTSVLFLFFILSGCEYEKREPVDLSNLPDVVSFSNDIIPVFSNNCIRCHDGSITPDLTSENAYFDLSSGNYINTDVPENSYLYKKISGNGTMAQYADDYNRALILKWIEQGAEEN
jgi:hypothetical protein